MYSATYPRDSSVSVFARTYQIIRIRALILRKAAYYLSSTANCRFCSLSRGEEDPSIIAKPTCLFPSLYISLSIFFFSLRQILKMRKDDYSELFLLRNYIVIFSDGCSLLERIICIFVLLKSLYKIISVLDIRRLYRQCITPINLQISVLSHAVLSLITVQKIYLLLNEMHYYGINRFIEPDSLMSYRCER